VELASLSDEYEGGGVRLTVTQEQAVAYSGRNLQLIACAGSGKTEVVARRVVQLLTPGAPEALQPRNIIAFTFTDKAAAELKERIVTRTRESLGDIPAWSRDTSKEPTAHESEKK